MSRPIALVILVLFALAGQSATARAQVETPMTIRVTADSGKPLGAIAGEAQVTLRDKTSGDAMASGETHQGTFDVSVDLVRPTLATVTATGPLASLQGLVTVSRDIVLIPGKNYSDKTGIALALPGAIVSMTSPVAGQARKSKADEDIMVSAYVSKLDGDPAPAEAYEVETLIYSGAVLMATAKMVPAGNPGEFAAKLKFPLDGTYTVVITAYDPVGKSAGMDTGTFVIGGTPAAK